MTDDKTRIIIEYIKNHPGSTSDQIAKGVENSISRVPALNILKELKENKIIINKSTNRRDNRFYLNEDNYFLKTLNYLSNFQNNYFEVLGNVLNEIILKPVRLEEYEKQRRVSEVFYPRSSYEELFSATIALFFINIQKILFRLAIEFPNISTDKGNIEKLSLDILSKVFLMYTKLSQELDSKEIIKHLDINPQKIKTNSDLLNFLFEDAIFSKDNILGYEYNYHFFKLEKEYLKII